MHAVRNLLNNIEEALRWPGGKLFTVYINFSKAFDLLNRNILMANVCDLLGQGHLLTRLIGNMLAKQFSACK
jgi:hypothetical protein